MVPTYVENYACEALKRTQHQYLWYHSSPTQTLAQGESRRENPTVRAHYSQLEEHASVKYEWRWISVELRIEESSVAAAIATRCMT